MATHLKYNVGWLTHNNKADYDNKPQNKKRFKNPQNPVPWGASQLHPNIFILSQHLGEMPDLDGLPKS